MNMIYCNTNLVALLGRNLREIRNLNAKPQNFCSFGECLSYTLVKAREAVNNLVNIAGGGYSWASDKFCAAFSIMAVDTTLLSKVVLVKLFIPNLRWASTSSKKGEKKRKNNFNEVRKDLWGSI